MRKNFFVVILFLLSVIFYNQNLSAKKRFKTDFFLTPYVFYQSHLHFKNNNRYTENFMGYGLKTTWRANSFLMISANIQKGDLKTVKKDVSLEYESSFPQTNAIRSFYSLALQADFYFFTSHENIFYAGIGYGYLNMSELTAEKVVYPDSAYSMYYYSFSLGDKFLLFPKVTLDVEVSFNSSLKKISPPQEDKDKFSHYWIQVQMGFSYLF